jgi:hypothetical protein
MREKMVIVAKNKAFLPEPVQSFDYAHPKDVGPEKQRGECGVALWSIDISYAGTLRTCVLTCGCSLRPPAWDS